MSRPKLYQNQISGLACLISGGGFALASLVQLVEPRMPPLIYIGLAVFGAYFVAFRLGRGGLLVRDEGVVVRNPFRTTPVTPREQIVGCVLDTWHGMPDVAFLELKNGTRVAIPMLEISPLSRFGKDDSVHRAIEEFNAWVSAGQRQ
jgi:hypothetical protein